MIPDSTSSYEDRERFKRNLRFLSSKLRESGMYPMLADALKSDDEKTRLNAFRVLDMMIRTDLEKSESFD
jgi:hypothetical protein